MLIAIILFPLIGFFINGVWSLLVLEDKANPQRAIISGSIASLAMFGSFLLSIHGFVYLQMQEPIFQNLADWFSFKELHVGFDFKLDHLSSLFTLIITGIGLLIHIYSIEYMQQEPRVQKFFAYLNLFCAAMLVLVLASNIIVLFLGWEGVGLCSYCLIGFWYQDTEKVSAGKKAFIINRIGDFAFLLGTFLMFFVFKTFYFHELYLLFTEGMIQPSALLSLMCLCFFIGCTGKSAQIPLYVWLPDAMAGPTPVSALIHAATMVTSGIYFINRVWFLFDQSGFVLNVIAWVGVLTALVAASIALCANDIKKVLAYSTVSQLGFMFLACGVGAYATGVFHVMTHAFFKALMFLGAGSVIHGFHGKQDIHEMGGVRRWMPKTFFCFMLGWLAICGIPPWSGFFSKDEILWKVLSSPRGHIGLWALATFTAGLTAFYMTRLVYLVFFGHARFDEKHAPHESSLVMIIPLGILGFLASMGGFLGFPQHHWLEHFLEPIFRGIRIESHSFEWQEFCLMIFSVSVSGFGIWLAYWLYSRTKYVQTKNILNQLFIHKWYVDEIYEYIFVKPILILSHFLSKYVDTRMLDGFYLNITFACQRIGIWLQYLQNGSLAFYGAGLLIGFILMVGVFKYGLV